MKTDSGAENYEFVPCQKSSFSFFLAKHLFRREKDDDDDDDDLFVSVLIAHRYCNHSARMVCSNYTDSLTHSLTHRLLVTLSTSLSLSIECAFCS